MNRSISVWRSTEGLLALHPWEVLGIASAERLSVIANPGVRVEGVGWWPTVVDRSVTYASALPSNIWVASTTASLPEALPTSEPERLKAQPGPQYGHALSKRQAEALIRTSGAYIELSARYWTEDIVKRLVSDSIATAPAYATQLANACLVASTVQDAAIWTIVASRAREPNDAAEACLRDWPDERGLEFFRQGLVNDRRPLIGNSLLFFLTCYPISGLAIVSGVLGNPFVERSEIGRVAKARRLMLKVLEDFYQSTSRDADSAWREYAAATFLVSTLEEGEDWIAQKSMEVLRRTGDVRGRVVRAMLVNAGFGQVT
jgi:hypothetical protein